jgi:hypothetical protein
VAVSAEAVGEAEQHADKFSTSYLSMIFQTSLSSGAKHLLKVSGYGI